MQTLCRDRPLMSADLLLKPKYVKVKRTLWQAFIPMGKAKIYRHDQATADGTEIKDVNQYILVDRLSWGQWSVGQESGHVLKTDIGGVGRACF